MRCRCRAPRERRLQRTIRLDRRRTAKTYGTAPYERPRFGRYAIREIRLTRTAPWSALRDKNLTGGSVPPVPQTVAAIQLTDATLKRRSPFGVLTTATSPARSPRSASATGDSIESLPSPGADSREDTSVYRCFFPVVSSSTSTVDP